MSLLSDGKPMFVHIDERTRRMWWVMPDFETVRLFVTGKENWIEIPQEEWKLADIEYASILPDIARNECEVQKCQNVDWEML